MKLNLELALFYGSTAAFGNMSGEIDLPVVPQTGNTISFMFPNNDVQPMIVSGFDGLLTVAGVRFAPQSLKTAITLDLGEITVQTREDARKVMTYLENGFGLFGDEYAEAS
ncbi:hypothetical protein [Rhizobacter sp. OV335]|uniref:hypothetical protein n=1 Tax=Rhizobacter sp. OV335 TaxID=1500264 RepID=UPI00091A255C|nr:hypothetical protein [Rhizobacter sp. OV335]SHM96348.1 hypothetical protein SAMN02787076_02719 [Rhizobacter sp. OV335]